MSESELSRPTKRRWNAASAPELIASWKKSGLSQAAFCRRERISLSTLSYWIRKIGKSSRKARSKQSFVELAPSMSPSTLAPPIELVTPSGFQLRLSSGFLIDDLQRTLTVLKSSC